MRVDEAGDDPAARGVDNLATLVLAEPGDDAVGDRDVHLEPLLGEDGQHASATDDEVGRLVPSRHSEPAAEASMRDSVIPLALWKS